MSTSETAATPAAPPLKVRSVVGFLVFCELASGFTQGYYPPLISKIAEHLGVGAADITWFTTVQSLAAAVCVPILAKLGDQFGHRRILRIAVLCVLVGALVTALVPNFSVVLVGRLLIGPLAVWLPLEIALVHNQITGETARRSIGLLVSMLTFGAVVGSLGAGIISNITHSVPVMLLAPVVFLLVSTYAVWFKVPESTTRAASTIDGVGFAGLAVFMIALLFALRLASTSGFGAASTVILFVVALVAFVAWVWWELRAKLPAIDVRLVVSRKLGPIYLAALAFGMVMFGTQTPGTTFLTTDPAKYGYGFAAGTGTTSAISVALTVMATIGGAVFAQLAKRIGMRTVLVLGTVLPAASYFFEVFFHDQLWQIWLISIVSGAGMGLLLGALPALVAELAPKGDTGIGAGVYNSLRTLGGAIAGAVFALFLAATVPAGSKTPGIGGYISIWVSSGVLFVVALVAVLFVPLPSDTSETDAVSA